MNESNRPLMLSVVMPVYNEEATVETAVTRLRAALDMPLEIIRVADAPTDDSRAILGRLLGGGMIDQLLTRGENRGQGAGLRKGCEMVEGDVVVIQDAGLEYDPRDLPRLLEPIEDGRADAVFGSRFLSGPHRVLYFWHRVGNGVLTLVSNMLTDLNLTDMETCYKMVRTDLLQSLPLWSNRCGISPDLTARRAQADAMSRSASV